MPEPDFDAFYDDLLMEGVAPRHASRASAELKQHFMDLRADLRSAGFDREEAASAAAEQLGSLDTIGRLIASEPAHRHWAYRYPMLGRVVLPIAYAVALPAPPLAATAACANLIARWSFIASLSAVITAGMFLAIQMSITLG